MSYNNNQEFPKYMQTAGKVSVFAAIIGLAVFIFAFIVDVGHQELQKVSAQTASTSLIVLNTPPVFLVEPYEVVGSSVDTPTNSGTAVSWSAIGSDANGADYYLLVCSTNASPTPNNNGAPTCGGGVQWGVSAATVSDTIATVSTTTVESADNGATQFLEQNDWFAWVCDGDPTQAACTVIPSQGLYATSTSPFNMNQRPVLTSATPAGSVDPGAALTFNSVSTDPDTIAAADDLFLIVCQNAADYDPATNSCTANFVASTTVTGVTANASAATTTAAILRDGTYPARAFLIDQHGHEATGNIDVEFTVNNVAPTVLSGDVILNGGNDISLTNPSGGETTGFTLNFTVTDANSCLNASAGPEITGFQASVFRTSIGTTTCDVTGANYDPNFCYASGLATTTWNLVCTPDAASCTGATDADQDFNCTFPLWFLADPTDDGPHSLDSWSAAVAGVDDNAAISSQVRGATSVALISAPYFGLLTAVIPYGALAPGDDTGNLGTSTTFENLGNTGLDQELDGSAMCPGFISSSTDCSLTADSTVFAPNQRFSSTTLSYNSPLAQNLPTTTIALPATLDLDIPETTATSTFASRNTFWGIAVPSAITVAGSYTGLNTFFGIIDSEW